VERDTHESGIVEEMLLYLDYEGQAVCLETLQEFEAVLEALDQLANQRERVHTSVLLKLIRALTKTISRRPDNLH
jgi:hypothetical protein